MNGQARLRNNSGQVIHTQLPGRWHFSLVYKVVKLGMLLPLPTLQTTARSLGQQRTERTIAGQGLSWV